RRSSPRFEPKTPQYVWFQSFEFERLHPLTQGPGSATVLGGL
ncbi:hypothetical protein A2U01_0079747, partial [Trifolium medium]|nr:hypothetical protein [Trifolium medium]